MCANLKHILINDDLQDLSYRCCLFFPMFLYFNQTVITTRDTASNISTLRSDQSSVVQARGHGLYECNIPAVMISLYSSSFPSIQTNILYQVHVFERERHSMTCVIKLLSHLKTSISNSRHCGKNIVCESHLLRRY